MQFSNKKDVWLAFPDAQVSIQCMQYGKHASVADRVGYASRQMHQEADI